MKRPTREAARCLGLHPANLLLHLASMGAEFVDVWPEVEDAWIDEIRRQDWSRFGLLAGTEEGPAPPPPPALGVGEAAAKVLAKLVHKKTWGSNTVGLDTLRNHWCQSVAGLDAALDELLRIGYLRGEGPRGPYSLNQSLSREIERIAQAAGIRKD